MSEVKPPITDKLPQFEASDEEIKVVIKSEHLDRTGMPLVEQRMTAMTIILITGLLKAQRDADWEHEQRTVREIFEEMEKRWKQYKYPLIAGTRKEETYFIMCSDNPEWEVFKSRFLEKKPKEEPCQK